MLSSRPTDNGVDEILDEVRMSMRELENISLLDAGGRLEMLVPNEFQLELLEARGVSLGGF